MEFGDLGAHCSHPECRQLDFLPFTCPHCSLPFCLQHRTADSHDCGSESNNKNRDNHKNNARRGRVAPDCPMCGMIVALPAGESDPNKAVDAHISSGECARELDRIAKRKARKNSNSTPNVGCQHQNNRNDVIDIDNDDDNDEDSNSNGSESNRPKRKTVTTGKKVGQFVCDLDECTTKEAVRTVCRECRKSFCLKHRNPLDHSCSAIAREKERSKVHAPKSLARNGPSNLSDALTASLMNKSGGSNINGNVNHRAKAAASVREAREKAMAERETALAQRTDLSEQAMKRRQRLEAIQKRLRGGSPNLASNFNGIGSSGSVKEPASVIVTEGGSKGTDTCVDASKNKNNTGKEKGKSGGADVKKKKLTRMQLRVKATGDKKVPAKDRSYFMVGFPRDRNIDPRPIYLSKKWTVGKAIDAIATVGRVTNNNNKPGEPRLNLFVESTGAILPTNTALELLFGDDFADGDTIVLERGDTLYPEQVPGGKLDEPTNATTPMIEV